ncbi:MAG TPA: hypothetical protein VNZ64_09005 [Candidatus Acidoferrum sp.]|jgi:hypothetical protein|nr:hypothetical protein [Candidatus Acidoferrum sp.]
MIDPKNDLNPEAAPAPTALSSIAPATQDQSCIASATEGPSSKALATEDERAKTQASAETRNFQLATLSSAALQPRQNRPAGKPRNGKIARLPKLERDMVDRMLSNNLPRRKIVAALQECGFHVTERNVSNWKTRGGHKEWCAAQEHALELRTFQDNLTEFLRRHDASELPEVGLQSAATTLSAILLRPDLMRELIADPDKYSKLIELQCRLAREIQALQKNRDAAANALGRRYNPERLKRQNEEEVENIRQVMSSKIGNSIKDPDIPHRNFIPRELDPAPPVEKPMPPLDITKFHEGVRRRLAPGNSQPQAAR